MSRQKVIKAGNSLVVTVPSDFVQTVGIKVGQEVIVDARPEDGKVAYFFSGTKQLPLSAGLLKKKQFK